MFDDEMRADNHQSASDYHVWATGSLLDNGTVYPVVEPGFSTYIISLAAARASQGTNFRTHSLFVNDRWSLDDRWTFNLGVRYDRNEGKDSSGSRGINDSAISPRLGSCTTSAGAARRRSMRASDAM